MDKTTLYMTHIDTLRGTLKQSTREIHLGDDIQPFSAIENCVVYGESVVSPEEARDAALGRLMQYRHQLSLLSDKLNGVAL